ncbi:MAG: chemotaxis protein CheA [Bdellovibrionales bacterium]|nr:chemotaxis protein CheA [Bdellovibrionales bacterium]
MADEMPVPPAPPTTPEPAPVVDDKSFTLQLQKKPATASAPPPQADESIRVSLARLERLLNFVGELVILETVLQEQVYANNPLLLRKTVHQLGKVTKEVQDISMSLRMVPLKQTFQKLQRIVRDTSNALSKKVSYVSLGDDTEVDKTVLENISDPLVHIVRNAVDHGIEAAELRRERGKDETGAVRINAFHQGGKLVIEVTDDGGGIDTQVLRKKAVEKGILREGQAISERDALHLIFHPGFSTKAVVTEVSGRGVGMDVVKTNIEALQGEVQVESVVGKGSVFRILLPLTLAIIDGMIIRSDGERFVIPLNHVKESFRPKRGDVNFVTGLGEVLKLRDDNIPLYRLGTLLGRRPSAPKSLEESIAVVVKTEGFPFAVLIDDIVGQHQVVIKKLGAEIQGMKGFSGSAILGDGKPSLILELNDLVSRNVARVVAKENRRSA